MKKSVFNIFRKTKATPSENAGRIKKKRIYNAAANVGRQYKEADSKKRFGLLHFTMPKVSKKVLTSVIAVAIVAVMVPVIFATASGNNEVAKITEIKLQPSASTDIQDDTSGLFEGVNNTGPLDPTTDGELTSELTDTTTQADPQSTVVAALDPASLYTTFSSGMEDPFIAMIQGRLMKLDYMEPDEPTNLYGPVTTLGIQYFQRKNGLPVDGIAGPGTQALLFSEEAKFYTVSEGAEGDDVSSIQDRLKDLGYSVGVTSYFGTDTTKAVAYFQRMNGLTDDGNVGSETREMLYSSDAEPAERRRSSSSSSGGSGGSSAPDHVANPGSVEAFISAALAQRGDPYVRGGKGPDRFDCSGLVYYALNASGNSIGYMTSGGWASSGYTRISNMGDLRRGDIICVSGHVGIYLGDGTAVHASSSNGAVVVSSNIFISNYWTSNWICGRRPL